MAGRILFEQRDGTPTARDVNDRLDGEGARTAVGVGKVQGEGSGRDSQAIIQAAPRCGGRAAMAWRSCACAC